MLAKRIIPCLDVKNGKTVKGIHFENLTEVGDPVAFARLYEKQRADELVFLDITATNEGRKTMIEVVEKVAENIFIPFTVGGGISSVDDITNLLRAGADKVSLNSAAVEHPELLQQGANAFGNQCMVLACDGRWNETDGTWHVVTHGGKHDTGINVLTWVEDAVKMGAGEILLTSMDADGTKNGYDIALCKAVKSRVNVPVIASGGCGKLEDFKEVLQEDIADAALAASLFHYGTLTVNEVKQYLKKEGVSVRL